MIKYVIKFKDGSYWKCFEQQTSDLQGAWTFNKSERAYGHANSLGLTDFEIKAVIKNFGPDYFRWELVY